MASTAAILEAIAEKWPDVYALISISSEIRALAIRAEKGDYSDTKIRTELRKTSYWKTTTATARQWDADYAQDKATGNQLLAQTQGEVRTLAARLGIPLSAKDVERYALNVRRLGWTPQQLQESLAGRFRQSTAKQGLGTATVDQLRAMAADYGVSLSDHGLTAWARRLLGGTADEVAFRSYLVKQAQSLFPTIAADISEGQTVRDYFDPYVQTASRVLGINPDEVDLSDNRWRRALLQIDPKTGDRVPMSLDEWEADLKTNDLYGYDRTANGRRERDQFVGAFSNILGIR